MKYITTKHEQQLKAIEKDIDIAKVEADTAQHKETCNVIGNVLNKVIGGVAGSFF